jgi:ubiquinone/menaquinone biosynthesis C-methylase UbiE
VPAGDPFPPADFDPWAETYDLDVVDQTRFPFDGYERALETVVQQAAPTRGMSVLDLGTGTGNLAVRFAERGCQLWCTDFSESMLERARPKLPRAHFVVHDLRAAWPAELDRRFHRIVSAYVFHHFELDRKLSLACELVAERLMPGGRLVIADLSFPDSNAMQLFARSIGDLWEEEPYWLADEAVAALKKIGLDVSYVQVSPCAGVYAIESQTKLRS